MLTEPKIYAALDLGTNNCRLSIVASSNNNYKILDRYSKNVRLGQGLDASGNLSNEAMDRAIHAIKVCKDKLDGYNIYKKRYVTTEACRIAQNTDVFLSKVYDATGLELEIIDYRTETELAVIACGDLMRTVKKPVILFDIGGGSLQLAIIKQPCTIANNIDAILGLPLGVVTMLEKFNNVNNQVANFYEMKNYAKSLIYDTIDKYNLNKYLDIGDCYLFGTSGTATTLAGLYLNLPRYDRKKIDGLWLYRKDVLNVIDRLLSWDIVKRKASPCIGKGRADLVIAGCSILNAIMEIWSGDKVRVADRGLRDGILIQLMQNKE